MRKVFFLLFHLVFVSFAAAQGESMSGVISSTDTVSVRVHREPDLSAAGQLGKGGTLSIPLIGSVQLSGKTTASAESFIEAKFRDGYLVRPQVTVFITKRVEQTFTVGGEVTAPGVFKIPHGQALTLRQAISMAGGSTDIANLKKVALYRGATGQSYVVNLKMILNNKAKDVTIKKDDKIYVPEGWF